LFLADLDKTKRRLNLKKKTVGCYANNIIAVRGMAAAHTRWDFPSGPLLSIFFVDAGLTEVMSISRSKSVCRLCPADS